MTLTRRLILALALMAGIAPAFAAPPPPVPALPDSERRTSYSISGTTCACSVGFALFGDSTDFGNWIEVWLNGVLVPSTNYIITSPSGSLATLPRPITDAVLTFNSVQTGTVQIVGARRPRRVSQFSENQGVAARDLNQALTDLVAQSREAWDRTNDVTSRSPRVPPGETQSIWPPASQRANMSAIFDASGNLIPGVSVAGSTFAAGNGVSFTGSGPTVIAANLLAGTGIKITGTSALTITVSNAPFVSPTDYGAKCDGSTDDTTALQNMLNASAGKTVFFPAATCVISAHLSPQPNTVITGAGRDVAIIKQTARDYIFAIGNVSNVTISDIALLGTDNYISWSSSNTGAIFISPSTAQSGLTFRNLKLSGFNATYWIQGAGQSATITNVTFDNLLLTTANADIPTDGTATNNSNFGIALFSGSSGLRWENLSIKNVQVDGAAICFHIILFGDFYKYQIINNRLLNPGGANTGGHCTNGLSATNAYGISVYDLIGDGHPSNNGLIQGNYIQNPIAAGIYFVGDGVSTALANNSNQALISGNEIVGQTSSDSLLPRAAISVTDSTDVSVVGNQLTNNQNCIYFSAQNAGDVTALSNHCSSTAASSNGIVLSAGSNGSSNTDRRGVRANFIDVQGTAIVGSSLTGQRFNDVDVSGNSVRSASSGINFGANFVSGTLTIQNNSLGGTLGGTAFNVSSLTGSLSIGGNAGLSVTAALLPTTAVNGSSIFVSEGAPASSPCTGGSSGSTAFRQNSAWKCF